MSTKSVGFSSLSLTQIAGILGVVLLFVVPTGAMVVNQFDTVGPDDAIQIAPADGPNGAYAQMDADNELTINVTEHGVNPNAVTTIEEVFTITNVGNDSRTIRLSQTNRDTVTFYSAATGAPVDPDTNVTLVPGEELLMSLRIDTRSPSIQPETTLVTKLIFHIETVEPVSAPRADVPDSIDFETVPVGSNAVTDITVRNTGDETLEIESVAIEGPDADAFERASGGALPAIAPQESATIPIRFEPTDEDEYEATATLTTNDPEAETVEVALAGAGTVQDLTVIGPTRLNFGDVRVGDTEQAAVTLENTGSAPVTVTGIDPSGGDTTAFSADQTDLPVTLAPGQRHVVVVTFAPETAGSTTATLEIDSTVDEPGIPVELVGRGLAPDIVVSADSVGFSQIGRGLSENRTLTVENRGTAPLTISDVDVVGSGDEMFAVDPPVTTPLTLDVGASVEVPIRFTPTEDGAFEPDLHIRSNDPDDPVSTVDLAGTGLPPLLDVSTDHLDFGEVTVGSEKTLNISVSNPGDPAVPVQVSETRLVSGSADAFEIIGGEAPFSVAPGETEQITIRYAPQSAGIKTAQLRILSDAEEEQIDVWMSNTGWRIRVQQVSEGSKGVESDDEPWDDPVSIPGSARSEMDANEVPRGVGLTVDVSVPSTRDQPSTIETVTVAPEGSVGGTKSFDMNFIHHPTEPPVVGSVNYTPPEGQAVTEFFGLEHSIPNEELSLTQFTYSVKKSALPDDVDPEELVIRRYAGGTWNELEPELIDETETAYVFFVDPPGFSQFVLTAPASEDEEQSTDEPTGESDDDSDGDTDGTEREADDEGTGEDRPETVVEKGDTTIRFPGENNPENLGDLISVEGLTVPTPTTGGSDGPAASIMQGQDIGDNAERIDFGGDISLTISGSSASREQLDLKGADALATVQEPIMLVGTHSLFGSKESIDDSLRMIHRVEITVPPEYENRSAIVQLRVPKEQFGSTTPENATIARNSGGWQLLETDVAEETDEYVVLSAYTPGFSEFAVFADNSVTYEWDVETYDDPLTGRQIDPVFDDVGEFNVTLTVTDAFGLTDVADYRILVNDVPSVSLQRPPVIPPNETVTLVADVVDENGNVTVVWEFADGTTETGRVVERSFPAGEQTVSVVARDEYGASDDFTETFTVGGNPLVQELQQLSAGNLAAVFAALLLVALALVIRGRPWTLWPVFARKRDHPPEIEAVEDLRFDVAAGRVVIPKLSVTDAGDDLDEITVTIFGPSDRPVGSESGVIGGESTYEGTNVFVTITEPNHPRPDSQYAVEIRVTDEAGDESVHRAELPIDPFRYPLAPLAR
ncbi:choice-of-anchor D domain-containing protein [Halobellus captivus]|uniref:choice-of-anchor D domain-containing protein n=1 Tax=Halobellus captivus TaxID=2592614 RepID=UPI0011A272E4|nr:choice-of-anchor D domain-containing protein [Halobellus captivus]